MTEAHLIHLKTIVERAVRPVCASTSRKRKMREELLAHVSGVFEEESAKLGDEQAALERAAQRFGNPADVTSQLQESVPASDNIRRYWEGQPAEPAVRSALRIAWVTAVLALVVFIGLLFAAGGITTLPGKALRMCLDSILALPVYLFGLTVLTGWMEKALYESAQRSRLNITLLGVGSWLVMMLGLACLAWRTGSGEWDYLTAILLALWLAPLAVLFPYSLARSSLDRRRNHEEWARLEIA
jgi:hypothetical protein